VNFEFATVTRIVFGAGSSKSLPKLGARPFLVGSRRAANVDFEAKGEPTVDMVRSGVAAYRSGAFDYVVAIGGGSAIDCGKAIAAMVTNSGEPLDYLEIVGKGAPLEREPAPFIAVPTTAGTGAEVTRNAVLGVPEHRVKASLRSPMMLPKVAVVDPELTLDLSPEWTAYTGMDALTQLIEPFVSAKANAMTDMYCIEGMKRVARSLRKAYFEPSNLEARTDMAFASLLGGLALANAGLGVVHGFAAPIGGMYDIPHGAICAALLPHGMQANLRAAPARFQQIATLLTGKGRATAEDGVQWVSNLSQDLNIPQLRIANIAEVVAKAKTASSMKANPVVLTDPELTAILQAGAQA
jgi:alcohol dehydrogenase class IV